MRRYERIRNYPQRYKTGFGAAREWKNDAVASIVYMIQDRDLNNNVDTDDILSLLAEWEAEYCMDTPSRFHMRESYALKTQSHDHDTPTYMEALSGENLEEYFKAMDDEIQSLMRMYTWEIFQGSQLLIKMYYQENGTSIERGNLIGKSINSRHYIV